MNRSPAAKDDRRARFKAIRQRDVILSKMATKDQDRDGHSGKS
jgi:hypothetical protein